MLQRNIFPHPQKWVAYVTFHCKLYLFVFQGDMRQALNNLQSTKEGFGHVNSENVFKVSCDVINGRPFTIQKHTSCFCMQFSYECFYTIRTIFFQRSMNSLVSFLFIQKRKLNNFYNVNGKHRISTQLLRVRDTECIL